MAPDRLVGRGDTVRILFPPIVALTAFILWPGPSCCAEEPLPRVTLTDRPDTMTLANGLVAMTFQKPGGVLTSMTYRGRELLAGGKGYVQVVVGGGDGSRVPGDRIRFAYRLVRRGKDLVEIAFVNVNPRFPFEVENHYVLRAGAPGFYHYLVAGHDARRHTGVQRMHQLNLCLRVDARLFTHAAVDEERIDPFPSPEALRAAEEVMDATLRLRDGRIYSKYFYSAAMNEAHRVHGVMGEGLGLWIIMPSHEHLNGGPEHQELTVHQTRTTPVLLRHFTAAHYGAGSIVSDAADGSWCKASAPCFVYVNTGDGRAALWADAKRRAACEARAWPYLWLDDARFQLDRGSVRGRLRFGDGSPAEGGRIILVPHEEDPPDLAWQRRWRGYRFGGWTGSDGRFAVAAVRPGTYDLYAWKAGVWGWFRQPAVPVRGGRATDVGDLRWPPETDGQEVWQIGVPDRSATEFGLAQAFRRWGLWDTIARAHPDGVTFIVGKHSPPDLPFMLAVTQNADLSWRLPEWRIVFDYEGACEGTATLRLGLAGSEGRQTRLRMTLNGDTLAVIDGLVHDGAVHRSGVRGVYQQRRVPFDAALLRPGRNVLVLGLLEPGRPVGKRLGYPRAAVLLDCLRLEVPGG